MKTKQTLRLAVLALFSCFFSFSIIAQNNSLDFDGSNDRVNIGNVSVTGNKITVEAWINADVWKSAIWQGNIVNKEKCCPDYGYMLRAGQGGRIQFVTGNGSWTHVTSGPVLQTNTWHHIAATYDGSYYRIYKDGSQVYSLYRPGRSISYSSSQCWIGGTQIYGGRFFDGEIDEVRIWNVARTPAQIAANYNCELSTPQSGLVGYYKFNQGTANGNNQNQTVVQASAGPNGYAQYFSMNGGSHSNYTTGFPGCASNQAPVANCKNVTKSADMNCQAAPAASEFDNGSYDPDGDQLTFSINPAGPFGVGTHNVTLTVSDPDGAADNCSATLTVSDGTAPAIINACPNNITVCGAQTISWTEPTATDNCGTPTMTRSHDPGSSFAVGTAMVTYDFSDGYQSVSCNFTITVNETPDVSISESDLPEWCQGLEVLTADVNNEGSLNGSLSYSWDFGGASASSIAVQENGTYTVSVSDGNNCEGVASITTDVNLWDALSGYVMIGEEVDIDGNTVAGGGVGVTGSGKKAKIRGGSIVDEFVKAPTISISGGSSVGHQEIGQVTLSLPTFKSSNYNSDDITVPTGGSETLNGTAYGEIEVKKNATVTFTAAEIHIEDIDVEDGGTVVFSQDAELMIDEDFNLDEDCTFNSAGNFVVVYVGDRTTIDEGSSVKAHMYSVDKIHVKKAKSNNHTTMTGMFISDDKVDGDDYVDWNWDLNCAAPLVPSSNIIVSGNDGVIEPINNEISNSFEINQPELTLFPNPARDILNIQVDGIESGAKVMIFDSMGQLVWEQEMAEGQLDLQANLSNSIFQNGLYIVSVVSGNQKIAKRLVISK